MTEKSKILRSVAFVSFLRSFGYGSLWSFIVLFLTEKFHLSLTFVGSYLFLVGIIGASSQIFYGALTDSYGRKGFLFIGQIGQGFSFFLFGIGGLIGNVIILMFSILIQSLFSNMVFTSINTIIADIFEENERFKGYAIQRALANLGWGIGPTVGGIVYELNDLTISFIILGLFLSLVSIIFINIPETNLNRNYFKFSDIIEPLKNRLFLFYNIASFLTFVVFGQLTSTYPFYEKEIVGISVFYIGITWTLNGILVGIFQYPSARKVNNKNAFYFLIYGSLIYGLGYFILPFSSSLIILFISMIIITFGEIIYSSSATATAVNFAKDNEKGKYAGSFGFFTNIGRSMGTLYGGLIFSLTADYKIKWFLIFLLSIISSVIYFIIFKNKKRKIF
jgi:MFS family permease